MQKLLKKRQQFINVSERQGLHKCPLNEMELVADSFVAVPLPAHELTSITESTFLS